MVRVMIEPPRGEAENAVDNWVQNHNEWTDYPKEHSLTETTAGTDDDGTSYVRGGYRFIQEGAADELLDDLAGRLDSFQGGLWYRLGYHECDHDEDSPTGCDWEQVRENGSVPPDIPRL
jgi:hypothetical protein